MAAAPATDLLGPAGDLQGTRVSIRMATCLSAVPAGVDPKRSQAIPIPIPGLQQKTYEGFVEDGAHGQIPFYCQVMVVEKAKMPGGSLAAQLPAGIGKPPGGPGQPTDLQVTTSEGKESKWQTMRMTLPKQEFYYRDQAGHESFRTIDAIIDMYTHDEAGYSIMLVWRVPSDIEQNVGNVGLAELAKAVAGGVTVRPQ